MAGRMLTRAAAGATSNVIVNGYGGYLTNFTDNNGFTLVSSVTNVDDGFALLTNSNGLGTFNMFNTNYASNNAIFFNTNNYLNFGSSTGGISFATTNRGWAFANADRRTNSLYVSNVVSNVNSGINNYLIHTSKITYQNFYNDGIPNAARCQIRLIKETTGLQRQFLEFRANISPATAGVHNMANTSAFVFSTGFIASPATGNSYVLMSNALGNTWTYFSNAYVNL